MRILQLVHAIHPDQYGGLERYVGEFSAALAAQGHDVTVATKKVSPELPGRETLASGVRLVRLNVPPRSTPTYALQYLLTSVLGTARIARPGRFDVVHAHFPFQGLGVALRRLRYAYTFHAPLWLEAMPERGGRYAWPKRLEGPATAALRVIERHVVSGAEQRIVLSKFAQRELRELAPRTPPALVIDGGVDTEFFSPGPDSGPGSTCDPLILCARRLTPNKGVQNLIEAMPTVLDAVPGARLCIAGDGIMLDPLRRRAESLGVDGRIQFLGRLSSVELRDWYRRSTLCVTPTLEHEEFGLSTAEALACGTVVLGTPVGATPELLRPLAAELVAEDPSEAALARAILSLLSKPERMAELGHAARKMALERWSWASVVRRHEPLYASLARRGAAATSRGCAR